MPYKDCTRCASDKKLQKFKAYRNRLHGSIRKAKPSYYSNKFEHIEENMRQTWKKVKLTDLNGIQTLFKQIK